MNGIVSSLQKSLYLVLQKLIVSPESKPHVQAHDVHPEEGYQEEKYDHIS